MKNHDFTPKNEMFSNFRGGGGGARRVRPPLDPPLRSIIIFNVKITVKTKYQMFIDI